MENPHGVWGLWEGGHVLNIDVTVGKASTSFARVRSVDGQHISRQCNTANRGEEDPPGVQDIPEGSHICHVDIVVGKVLVGYTLSQWTRCWWEERQRIIH